MFTCQVCSRIFSSSRSLASHKNHHDPSYHEKSKSGGLSTIKKATAAAVAAKKERSVTKYSDAKCKQCHTSIEVSKSIQGNQFCNRSCAAIYTNQRRQKRDRQKPKRFRKYIEKECIECNSKFSTYTNARTCSIKCACDLRKKNTTYAHVPLNRTRARPSYLEQSFDSWLKLNNITDYTVEQPFRIVDGEGKYLTTYFGDFYFPNLSLLIELDGTQHRNQVEYDKIRDARISDQYNIRIIRITHKEYINKSRLDEVKHELGFGASGKI